MFNLNILFNKVGMKIKNLAGFYYLFGILISLLGAWVYWYLVEEICGGLIILGSGLAFFSIGAFLVYGFGELVENSTIIAQKYRNELEDEQEIQENPSNQKEVSKDSKRNSLGFKNCEQCGYIVNHLTKCTLNDETGLITKNLCESCIKKYHAKIEK